MKKAIAMKWVKALRSGKYKRGIGQLKTERGHCCLGVLCEVLGLERGTWNSDWGLSFEAQKKSGMKSCDGTIHSLGTDLATLNDMRGGSFKEIAKVIEKNWRSL